MNMLVLARDPLTFFQVLAMIVVLTLITITFVWHLIAIGMWTRNWWFTVILTILSVLTLRLNGFEVTYYIKPLATLVFFVLGILATFSMNFRQGVLLVILHITYYGLSYWLAYSLSQGGYPPGYYNFF